MNSKQKHSVAWT